MFDADAWRGDARLIFNKARSLTGLEAYRYAYECGSSISRIGDDYLAEMTMEVLPYVMSQNFVDNREKTVVMILRNGVDYNDGWTSKSNPEDNLEGAGRKVFDACRALGLKPEICVTSNPGALLPTLTIEIPTPKEL